MYYGMERKLDEVLDLFGWYRRSIKERGKSNDKYVIQQSEKENE